MGGTKNRKQLLRTIAKERKARAILYVTGDRPGLETRIGADVIDYFVDQLDATGPVERICLVLHTTGGSTTAAWRIVNLLHTFCEELEFIIVTKALSAGTLMCLGADRLVMSKQAALGPIDPSITYHPLNPQIPGAPPDARAPVSVEAVNGYLDMAKSLLRDNSDQLSQVLAELSNKVHPLVLGEIFRTRAQIRELARRLLQRQVDDEKKRQALIDFLCAESGSHDYTINRREARDLGLKVDKPDDRFYQTLKKLNENVRETLRLSERYDPLRELGGAPTIAYSHVRCLLESPEGGRYR